MTDASKVEKLVRGIGRRTEYLEKRATMIETPEQYLDVINNKKERKLVLRFLRSPTEFLTSETDPEQFAGIRLQKMQLEGKAEY